MFRREIRSSFYDKMVFCTSTPRRGRWIFLLEFASAVYSSAMYVPYVLSRKEKFRPRSVIWSCAPNEIVILWWFSSNFRSASLDHNSAFFFPFLDIVSRILLIERIKYSRNVSRKSKNYALYSSLFLASLRLITRERENNPNRSRIANKIFSRSSKSA